MQAAQPPRRDFRKEDHVRAGDTVNLTVVGRHHRTAGSSLTSLYRPAEKGSLSSPLAVRHLLGHIEKKPAVAFFDATKKPAETAQITRVFPRAAPRDVIRALPLGKIRQFGRLFTVVEELVERHFHGPRQLLERLDRRNGMPVLDARDVAAKQPGALFDVALRKFLCFT
jgi:hypothetical protein